MLLSSLLDHSSSLPLILSASFAAGALASLTPCIYPMIPITIGIITAQKRTSLLKNFLLSLAYGLGIATVYTTLGYLSATSNILFGRWMANPYLLGLLTLFFLYLAFSLFGFYDLTMPTLSPSSTTSASSKGSFLYSFSLGLIAGTAASPCLTPALAVLLGYAGQQSNPLIGAAALFSFAIGLSSLLIVVATFSGSMSFLPRAGWWMEEIKKIFGFLLLGVIISLYEPIVAPEIISQGYKILLGATFIIYLYRLSKAFFQKK